MKLTDVNKKTDNYIESNGKTSYFFFNSYKNSNTKGLQQVEIPKELRSILNKYIKVNKNEYLLFDSNNNKLTSVKLNQRLTKLFNGRHTGINIFRKTYLTTKYGNIIKEQDDMNKDFAKMGSSQNQVSHYVLRT